MEASPRQERTTAPTLPFLYLEALWIQVTGTVCNLACRHCLVSAGPKSRIHAFMTVAQVKAAIDEGERRGARHYYFTGGEPFLHEQLLDCLRYGLARGAVTVLTNATLIDSAMATRLKRLSQESPYSLELRISLDGLTPEVNDRIRGQGSFAQVARAIGYLANVGLNPILTVTEADQSVRSNEAKRHFAHWLKGIGIAKPRLKYLPLFRVGREALRSGGYDEDAYLREGDLTPTAAETLPCGTSRAVTAGGWYPCPILVGDPHAFIGPTPKDAMRPISLRWQACVTCHLTGATCGN